MSHNFSFDATFVDGSTIPASGLQREYRVGARERFVARKYFVEVSSVDLAGAVKVATTLLDIPGVSKIAQFDDRLVSQKHITTVFGTSTKRFLPPLQRGQTAWSGRRRAKCSGAVHRRPHSENRIAETGMGRSYSLHE